MPRIHPRFGRAVPARHRLLLLTLILSCAAAFAYGPFARAGAQDDTDKKDSSTTAAPAAVPGSGLDVSDAPRRKMDPPEGSVPGREQPAAPGKAAEGTLTPQAAVASETWRAADGPRVINGTYVIPAGTTVTVEPGVRIQIDQNSLLLVEGALVGRGTPDRHITITGATDYSSDIQVPGRFELEYAEISAQSDPRSGGTYTCSNCRYTGSGGFFIALGYTYTMPPYVELRHTTFDGQAASLSLDNTTAVLRDVAFVNGAWGRIFYSYVYLDDVRSDNSAEFGLQFRLDGRWYLNNIQVRNAQLAALDLGGGNRGGNYRLGPNNTLAGSKYPVSLEWGGILAGSSVPAAGNANNYIVADTPGNPDWRGPMVWAPQSVPYVVLFPVNLRGGGDWNILPGTNVKFGPNFSGISDQSFGLIARGTPSAPVLFNRFDPAQAWGSIGNTVGGNRYSNIILEGSQHGINTTVHNGAFAYVEDLILRNNETGAAGGVIVTGTRFFNNTTGYQETGVYSHSVGVLNAGPASPNSFEGNGVAVRGTDSVIEARGNWWNLPTGPTYGGNPGGTGERIEGGAEVIPFLTARPDYTDTPPLVRQHKPHFTYEPGTKLDITWDAEDDRSIVSHRILFNPDGNWSGGFQTVAEGLPGSERAYEWTVPATGYAAGYGYSTVRVVAVDSAGHERFDDRFIQIPSGDLTGNIRITSNYAGQTLRTGQRFDVTFVAEGDARQYVIDAFLLLDNDAYTVSLGGVAGTLGTLPSVRLPYVSTDRARLAFRINAGRNRTKWFYGDFFQIRPDPRVGDAAPSVSIASPSQGAAFPAGGSVRVSWFAFDDEAVDSFELLASYDAGRSWNLIAEDLPATTTSYDLKTGGGSGFADVRVRVVAIDRRFQQTSAETSFALTPTGKPNVPPSVRLERPTADSAYVAGATLALTAEAADADGSIAKVEFFDGATPVGTDTAAPFEVSWQSVTAGKHTLVARATDNTGAQKDSASVNVTVHAEPPAASPVAGAAWGARYNGPANSSEVPPVMTLDAAGNVYLTSGSNGIGSDQDIVTVKYDPAGRQLWAARYGNPDNRVEYPDDISVDTAGNVYVTGTAWRGLPPGGTDYDIITIKYDSAGNQQWVRFHATADQEYGVALEADANGNAYVTGRSYFKRPDGNLAGQFLTLKYGPAGELLWTRSYTGPEGRGAAPVDLKLDSAGNVYVGGAVAVTGTNGVSDNNLAVVKYDPAGTLLRAAQYDTPGTNWQDFDSAVRLRVGGGNVYLIGQSWPDQCCEVTAARYDAVLLKFDANLGLLWAARWGLPGQTTEMPNDVVFDGAGNVYVTGGSASPERAGDAFTLKYDAAGKLLWQRVFEGTTYEDAEGVRVLLDPSGGVQVGVNGPGAANYDYALVRYLADGTQSGVRRFNGPGNLDDLLSDAGVDGAGNVYLTGIAFVSGSGSDLFTVKVASASTPTPTPTPIPTPTPARSPYGGTPAALPGQFEAEDFDQGAEGVTYHDATQQNEGGAYRQTGVDIYKCPDAGCNRIVGWVKAGEWLEYTVQTAAAGAYTFEARVSGAAAGGRFHVKVDGVDVTGPLQIPNTGGTFAWQTVSKAGVNLAAGQHVVRVVVEAEASDGWAGNFDWFKFSAAAQTQPAAPVRIQAEDFDQGAEGAAYHDATPQNEGGAYRQTGVDIYKCANGGCDYLVGWIKAGEWLNYTADVAAAGTYTLNARVSNGAAGGTFHVTVDGVDVTGPLQIPNTGSTFVWATAAKEGIALTAGRHAVRVVMDAEAGGWVGNFDWLEFTPAGQATQQQLTFEAEDFDDGAEGVAYHDVTSQNEGGAYRQSGVDIYKCTDGGCGHLVGWVKAGEWLRYTKDVPASGSYTFEARVSNGAAGGTFHVTVDGVDVTGPVSIPNTGGTFVWANVSKAGLNLSAGRHVVRVVVDAEAGGWAGNFDWFRLSTGTTAAQTEDLRLQAEDFDQGAEGVAYHDVTSQNEGGVYRQTGVDIHKCADGSCDYLVGWIRAGEWLNYTADLKAAGTYTLSAKVSNGAAGGTFHVEVDGTNVTGPMQIPNTGGTFTWQTVSKAGVSLSAGRHTLRVVMDADGANGWVGNFDWLNLSTQP